MELTFTQKKSIRKSFGKLKESLSIPNLIEVQKNSYNEFLKSRTKNNKNNTNDEILKDNKGLLRVFKSIFPINDVSEKSSLEFISYHLENSKSNQDPLPGIILQLNNNLPLACVLPLS